MRYFASFCAVATCLLIHACIDDLSCYRDMIIGTWVEQTHDGQVPETNLRAVHVYDRPSGPYSGRRAIQCMVEVGDGDRKIEKFDLDFDINCKIITTTGMLIGGLFFRDEEVMRFTDSTLRVKVITELVNGHSVDPVKEITYKKMSANNPNAKTIQDTWEVVERSDPSMPPFQIKFLANDSYLFFFKNEDNQWEEKSDEAGKYFVFDAFLMTSFFNNSIFGAVDKNDVACWDMLFTHREKEGDKEEELVMSWSAVVVENGQRKEKSFLFAPVVVPADEP